VVTVVGAGFAGVEAAWTLAERGHRVRLVEMRPETMTPAHETGYFAELVCSNSLKSKSPTSPAGQLKSEMAALGSVVLATALEHEVPAGEALGVDRDAFGRAITERVSQHPLIEVVAREWLPSDVDEALAAGDVVILATGPLTTSPLASYLAELTGRAHLYFYDAVSPTVDASSLDRNIVFAQSRYDKGEGDDYLNCPFDKETYQAFVHELVNAERAPFHAFEAGGKRDLESDATIEDRLLEKIKYFAGCTPIEAIAEKGERSLAFGNFKPVGLTDPRTGRRPWAALQLRPENKEKTLYSLVACQTRLKWGEQRRVFRMVPGLENSEFVRYGVIHRNTYLDAPKVLDATLQLRDRLYVAGQLTGVEGYVESAAFGIYVGLAVAYRLESKPLPTPPPETAYGALLGHLQDQTPREFAPMNINWGLLPDPDPPIRDKQEKRAAKIEAAQSGLRSWMSDLAGI
jgi:methylenetetrahydrofolate--tRNA-(uracil-5-)-methyltransferase